MLVVPNARLKVKNGKRSKLWFRIVPRIVIHYLDLHFELKSDIHLNMEDIGRFYRVSMVGTCIQGWNMFSSV